MRYVIALVLAALPTAAYAKLEIRDIQASHGQLGPERKSNEYISGDQVYFRYTIAGIRTDADGRVRGELRIAVTDAKGKVVVKGEFPLQQAVALGGDTVPASATFTLNEDVPPGEYELTVEVADLLAKETASFKRKVTCKAQEFSLVQMRFHYDSAGLAPARVGGTVSQTLYIKMQGVGFDRSKGEIDVDLEILVLDTKGNSVMPKPIRATVHNEKPEEVKQIERLNLSGALSLNRPGDFVLRIAVTDKMSKKKVSFEAPLHVTAP
jgi:hypothetical protein